jgi:hypothetical protein
MKENTELKQYPSYYAIIPADVRYANIKPNAKLLFGEISALSNKYGVCNAGNKYFSNLYNVSKSTVSRWISELENNKFITVKITRDINKQIINRSICLCLKKSIPIDKKSKENTNINTYNTNKDINNTIYNRNKYFKELVLSKDYDYNMLIDFYEYWSEKNKSNTKMRFELQATWNLDLRLSRWSKNNFNSSSSKLDSQLSEYNKGKKYL